MRMSTTSSGWADSQGMDDSFATGAMASGSDEPYFYTVEEAALILRIGRTTAYRLAGLWVSSSGGDGLQTIVVGGQLRVPRVVLERLAEGPVRLQRRRADESTVIALRHPTAG